MELVSPLFIRMGRSDILAGLGGFRFYRFYRSSFTSKPLRCITWLWLGEVVADCDQLKLPAVARYYRETELSDIIGQLNGGGGYKFKLYDIFVRLKNHQIVKK